MKASITPLSKNSSKYDNEYFQIDVNGNKIKLERSEVSHLIQILDNGIFQQIWH